MELSTPSFTDFDLPKALQKALDEWGLITPTPIQQRAFPVIMSGKDVIGIAQTGTGKTLAYLLPIFKQWRFQQTDAPRVLVVVPTRELVVQVVEVVTQLTQFMTIRTFGVYGGTNINTQKDILTGGVDFLVGTPGRLMDLSLDGYLRFDSLQKLVIDEFDEILSQGFRHQMTTLLDLLKNKRQNILFSATMTDEVDEMLDTFFNLPVEVSLAPSGTPLEQINQQFVEIPNFYTKINYIEQQLKDPQWERVLLFVSGKRTADLLFEKLEEWEPGRWGVLHSNKSQNYRLQTLAQFQEKNLRGIITTDVMARGLDIRDISHVVNIELPQSPEYYIHRIGRTGRAEKTGEAVSLIAPYEMEFWIEIQLFMDQEVTPMVCPTDLEISTRKMDFEIDKKKIKFLLKRPKPSEGAAFHEKSDKNKKVNLGGPGKRNPRKTKPTNRGVERKRSAKKK
ncbi:MAG: DEAD/DEAH box helicase [Flavobacterium sp. BFFFF2]|nr:MAG: DEAD/DEAH box helicase [Flavobacterium sp. BFFFF2]